MVLFDSKAISSCLLCANLILTYTLRFLILNCHAMTNKICGSRSSLGFSSNCSKENKIKIKEKKKGHKVFFIWYTR